uniref:RES domain-containing protein n=1 Tax=Bosea sp. NBC_00436 TaxID=2969620 RepID=A0A9E7ZVS8_9HYPH
MLVCPDCFADKGLQKRIIAIRSKCPKEHCDLHPTKKGVPVAEVAAIIDPVIRENFASGYDDPDSHEPGDNLRDLLYDLTGADHDGVVSELISVLIDQYDQYDPRDGDEAFYDEENKYTSHQDVDRHSELWERFRHHILHSQRYFSAQGLHFLKQIFEGIHFQRDHAKRPPVYMIAPEGANASFYRARIAKNDEELTKFRANVAEELSPPPKRLRTAGRLNPAGIATFYGAFDPDTCIAELRPSVGNTVAVAKFTIKKPICVLDMTRFSAPPKPQNIFVPNRVSRVAQWLFMQKFMQEMSRPISPEDQYLDYLPTQAVAEYLLHHHRAEIKKQKRCIDAIIYQSAQRPRGKNIAIFGLAGVLGEDKPKKKPVDNSDDLFDLLDFVRRMETRIVEVPNHFQAYRINGAEYDPKPYDTY